MAAEKYKVETWLDAEDIFSLPSQTDGDGVVSVSGVCTDYQVSTYETEGEAQTVYDDAIGNGRGALIAYDFIEGGYQNLRHTNFNNAYEQTDRIGRMRNKILEES